MSSLTLILVLNGLSYDAIEPAIHFDEIVVKAGVPISILLAEKLRCRNEMPDVFHYAMESLISIKKIYRFWICDLTILVDAEGRIGNLCRQGVQPNLALPSKRLGSAAVFTPDVRG